jgi:hypothetical protein
MFLQVETRYAYAILSSVRQKKSGKTVIRAAEIDDFFV